MEEWECLQVKSAEITKDPIPQNSLIESLGEIEFSPYYLMSEILF